MYPIRSSLFQCSNYTRIWDILTSYYEKVKIFSLSFSPVLSPGEHPRTGRGQVREGPSSCPPEGGELPGAAVLLLRGAFHVQRTERVSLLQVVQGDLHGQEQGQRSSGTELRDSPVSQEDPQTQLRGVQSQDRHEHQVILSTG